MATKIQTYALSAALVGSLGLNAAQLGAIGTAKAGRVESKQVKSEAVYTKTQVAAATGQQMANNGCALIDAEYELTGDDVCTIGDLRQIALHFNFEADPNAVLIRTYADKTFTLVPGEPVE